jgi:hypothetical protein
VVAGVSLGVLVKSAPLLVASNVASEADVEVRSGSGTQSPMPSPASRPAHTKPGQQLEGPEHLLSLTHTDVVVAGSVSVVIVTSVVLVVTAGGGGSTQVERAPGVPARRRICRPSCNRHSPLQHSSFEVQK